MAAGKRFGMNRLRRFPRAVEIPPGRNFSGSFRKNAFSLRLSVARNRLILMGLVGLGGRLATFRAFLEAVL